jgi:hypothetical protein
MDRLAFRPVIVVFAACLGACSSAPSAGIAGPCVPGVVRACTCQDGRIGGQGCGPDRNPEPCVCSRDGGAEPDPTGLADFLLDFGAVPVGERASRVFPVANLGEDHLVFQVGTIPTPFLMESRVPLSVAPGESDELRFGFRPTAEVDAAAVVLVSTGGAGFSVRLAGIGFEARIECETDRLDFYAVLRGQPTVREVRCINRALEPMALRATVEGDAAFSVASLPAAPLEWGETWTVPVTVTPEHPGELTGTLRLATPGGTVLAEIELWASVASMGFSCGPTSIDFGRVEPGATAEESIVCRNFDARPWFVTTLEYAPGSDTEAFDWSGALPLEVPGYAAGEPGTATIDLTFRPPAGVYRSYGARIILGTDFPQVPRMDITLQGYTGGPKLSCTPGQLDFQEVLGGLPRTLPTRCTNVGTEHLRFTTLETSNPEFTAQVLGGAFRAEGYEVGESFDLEVTYDPADEGEDLAELRLGAEAEGESVTFEVALEGIGHLLPPCDFDIVPPVLRFGQVATGTSATLEFAVVNHRDAECWIENLALGESCDSSFSLPRGEVLREVVPPHGQSRFPVRFAPSAEGLLSCEVHFDISNPADRHHAVPVNGFSLTPCVSFVPPAVDFGRTGPACGNEQLILLRNDCDASLTIRDVEIVAANPAEFVIRSAPPEATTVMPGSVEAFVVAYYPVDGSADLAAFHVDVGAAAPAMVPLSGYASQDGNQLDVFVQDQRTCFALRHQPADENADGTIGEGEIQVALGGQGIPATDAAGQEVWWYVPEPNAVCFDEAFVPPTGVVVEVSYWASCIDW